MNLNIEASFHAEVKKPGRVTIPKATRIALEIHDGDLVEINIRKLK